MNKDEVRAALTLAEGRLKSLWSQLDDDPPVGDVTGPEHPQPSAVQAPQDTSRGTSQNTGDTLPEATAAESVVENFNPALAALLFNPNSAHSSLAPPPPKKARRTMRESLKKHPIVVAGVIGTTALSVLLFVTKPWDSLDDLFGSKTAVAPNGSVAPVKPLISGINLKTAIGPKDIIGDLPAAIMGYRTEGFMVASYRGSDNKIHELSEHNGQRLALSASQGVEYFVVPKTNKSPFFNITQTAEKTTLDVDMAELALEIDPSIVGGDHIDADGTPEKVAIQLFDSANKPLTNDSAKKETVELINALTTEPKGIDAQKAALVSPQEWAKSKVADQIETMARPTMFMVGQITVLQMFEKGECGGSESQRQLKDAASAHVLEQVRNVLVSKGVNPDDVEITLKGQIATDDALKRLQKSERGKVYEGVEGVQKGLVEYVPSITPQCVVTGV